VVGLGLLSLACVGLPDMLMPRLWSSYGDVLVETTSSNEVKQTDAQGQATTNKIDLKFRLTKPLGNNRNVAIEVSLTNDYLKRQTSYTIYVGGQAHVVLSVTDIKAFIQLQEAAIKLVDDYAEFDYVK